MAKNNRHKKRSEEIKLLTSVVELVTALIALLITMLKGN